MRRANRSADLLLGAVQLLPLEPETRAAMCTALAAEHVPDLLCVACAMTLMRASVVARMRSRACATRGRHVLLLHQGRVVALAQPRNTQHALHVNGAHARAQWLACTAVTSVAAAAADLLLLVNFIATSKALQRSQSWLPLCLPHLNPRGQLHALVSWPGPDSTLVWISPNASPEMFHQLHRLNERVAKVRARYATRGACSC